MDRVLKPSIMESYKMDRVLKTSIVGCRKMDRVLVVDIKKSCRRRGVGNFCHRQDCLLRCVG